MQELDYNPSKKDLTDARIHHLLAEELKPYRRASSSSRTLHRRLSYSRHAVDDRDLSTQVNYKMHMNIRRMNDRKHHKRSKRGSTKEGMKQNHVSFPEMKQNGPAKQLSNDYINEVLNETVDDDDTKNLPDDWEDGLTFTAKSSRDEGDEDTFKEDTNIDTEIDIKRMSRDSESENRVTTPTATESQLPWKRDENETDGGALQQNEFPAWASNKEYLAYNSPSATFLGDLSKPRPIKSVIGLFRRESTTSGSVAGSDPCLAIQLATDLVGVTNTPARQRAGDRRSISICAVQPIAESSETGIDPLGALIELEFTGQIPNKIETHHSRRRGSLFELDGCPIPEEKYSKSLPDREAFGLRGRGTPLLSKMTGRPQLRRMSPQTTSLLSSQSLTTDSSDDDEIDISDEINAYDERRRKKHNF